MSFTEASRQRTIIYLAAAILAFMLGIGSSTVWNNRQAISDACVEFVQNWQD
jgi:hypothetical protein